MIYSPATTVAGGFFCAQKYPADAAQFPAQGAETRENRGTGGHPNIIAGGVNYGMDCGKGHYSPGYVMMPANAFSV